MPNNPYNPYDPNNWSVTYPSPGGGIIGTGTSNGTGSQIGSVWPVPGTHISQGIQASFFDDLIQGVKWHDGFAIVGRHQSLRCHGEWHTLEVVLEKCTSIKYLLSPSTIIMSKCIYDALLAYNSMETPYADMTPWEFIDATLGK